MQVQDLNDQEACSITVARIIEAKREIERHIFECPRPGEWEYAMDPIAHSHLMRVYFQECQYVNIEQMPNTFYGFRVVVDETLKPGQVIFRPIKKDSE